MNSGVDFEGSFDSLFGVPVAKKLRPVFSG